MENKIKSVPEHEKSEAGMKIAILMLERQKRLLEQKNAAFQELVKAIEAEKNELRNNVALNVNELIMPSLKKLRLKGESRKYGRIMEKNLEALTSSFGSRVTEKTLRLTPREIEICNMIKEGLTTKEVSGLLNISSQTTDKHRKNVRKKLKLSNKSINLTTYLKSL